MHIYIYIYCIYVYVCICKRCILSHWKPFLSYYYATKFKSDCMNDLNHNKLAFQTCKLTYRTQSCFSKYDCM